MHDENVRFHAFLFILHIIYNEKIRINQNFKSGGSSMSVSITGNAPLKECQAYVNYLEKKYNRKLKTLDIKIDGDYADLNYEFEQVPFERIRRITGYLVGTMDHWNSGKRAEEADRVKHSVSTGFEQL